MAKAEDLAAGANASPENYEAAAVKLERMVAGLSELIVGIQAQYHICSKEAFELVKRMLLAFHLVYHVQSIVWIGQIVLIYHVMLMCFSSSCFCVDTYALYSLTNIFTSINVAIPQCLKDRYKVVV